MPFRPSALQRRVLAFLRRCALQGLPRVDAEGRIEPRATIRAEAAQFQWIWAGCCPPRLLRGFDKQLKEALDELRLRELIAPVQGKVASHEWRWRRDDGCTVLMEQSARGRHVNTVLLVGKIAAGRLSGVRSRSHEPVSQNFYRPTARGLALLDRHPRRRRKPKASHDTGSRQKSTLPAPELDDERMAVTYGGRECQFPPRRKLLFGLLRRILEHPGRRVSFNTLREPGGPWADHDVDDSTMRGAVARLKKHLCQHELDALAAAIATMTDQGRGYVFLDPERLPSGTT